MDARQHLIILDMDGTLVDSRRDIIRALNQGLTAVEHAPLPDSRLLRHIGRPLVAIYTDLLDGDTARAEAATAAYRAYYIAHCADDTTVYPGVAEALAALRGVAFTCVGTTKRTYMALHVAQLLGIAEHLDHVQGTDDFPSKPDPTLLLHLMARFSVPAERTLMVGDTPSDILAGHAAKAHTAAVSYGYGDAEALEASGPEFVVSDPAGLLNVVKDLWGLAP